MNVRGRINRIIRAKNRASTPPNLLGIDRRIAYSHRKYHSGLMCVGVTRGLASKKFSGSVSILGLNRMSVMKIVRMMVYPRKSLMEKYEWKGIRSEFELSPMGFDDPVWCRNSKWMIISARITKGKMKCSAKKRLSVALSTAKPPHSHSTSMDPIYGMAENRLVITVAPQNLI